jgi:hypothetical protein
MILTTFIKFANLFPEIKDTVISVCNACAGLFLYVARTTAITDAPVVGSHERCLIFPTLPYSKCTCPLKKRT